MPTPVPGGVYPPIPTFFTPTGEIDRATLRTHISWLTQEPVSGILALGSNGEAWLLDDTERALVIETARTTIMDAQPLQPWTLLAGAADLSTRGTIARCRLVANAGADVAVILPSFAFPGQMTPAAHRAHFQAIADASPIPILIYNMPANAANIDLSADLILDLAQHPNIVGVKDSSGQVAKLARIAGVSKPGFAVLAGSGSFLWPTLAVGGTGTIAAVANVVPDLVWRLYQLWGERTRATSVADMLQLEAEARSLQSALIPLNQAVTAGYGVPGLKAALQAIRGYGGAPRPPLLPLEATRTTEIQQLYAELRTWSWG